MLTTVAILLLVGLGAGVLAGLLGIGGGLVIVPAMTWLLLHAGAGEDRAVPMAVATSLATMLMTAASAIWFHQRRAAIDWPVVARLGPAVGLGALAGAALATALPGQGLARIFAVVAAVIGVRMLLQLRPVRAVRSPRARWWWAAGPAIGMLSALVGIGGGSFNVPYLTRNGFPMVRAVAIASTCGWPIAAGGAAAFAVLGLSRDPWPASIGYVWLPGMVLIGLGGMLAAPLGVALAHRLPAAALGRLFGLVLVIIAVRMAW